MPEVPAHANSSVHLQTVDLISFSALFLIAFSFLSFFAAKNINLSSFLFSSLFPFHCLFHSNSHYIPLFLLDLTPSPSFSFFLFPLPPSFLYSFSITSSSTFSLWHSYAPFSTRVATWHGHRVFPRGTISWHRSSGSPSHTTPSRKRPTGFSRVPNGHFTSVFELSICVNFHW